MSLTNRFGARVGWAAVVVSAALGLAIAAGSSAMAGTVYWGGGNDASWATVANWSTTIGGGSTPGAVPGSGDNVIFDANGTIANEIGSLGGNQSALSVSFSNNIADNITIASGNTLTVGSGALTANSGHTVTLAGTVGVGSSSATTTSKVQAGELDITGTTTMSTSTGYTAMPLSVGASSGTATLQIDGGSLTLNGYGPNGYTMTVGDTQSTYGAGASGAVIQKNGATVTINNGPLTLGYNATGDNGSYTISDPGSTLALTDPTGGWLYVGHTGTGTFTQNGGTVNLEGNSSSNGLVVGGVNCTYNMNGGTLRAPKIWKTTSTAAFDFAGGTIAPYGSAGLTIGSSTSANNIDLTLTGGSGTISSLDAGSVARTVDVYSTITGGYGLNFAGAGGTINLRAANTYSGTTTISGGTLTLVNSGALQNSTLDYGSYGGAISFGSLTAATFGGLTGAQSLALPSGFTLSLGNNNGTTTYSGNLSGSTAGLTKIGAGTLTLAGTNSIGSVSGAITNKVQSGELDITGTTTMTSSSSYLPLSVGASSAAATLRISGGTLTVAGGDSANGYCMTVGDTQATYGGGAGTSGAVIQENNATVTLSKGLGLAYNASTDVGSYTISSGTLAITDTGLHGVLTIGRSGTGTFTQSGGTVNLYTTTGNGVVVGGGATGASGTYNMSGGVLRTYNIIEGAVSHGTFDFAGGTIAPYGSNLTIGSSTSANNIDLTLTGSGGTISSLDNAGTARTVDVYSVIKETGGAQGVTFAGTGGTINLRAANTYTGLTTVSSGTLAYGASDVIATGPVTVNGSSAVLSLGSYNDSVGTVTVDGGGSITGSGTLTSTGSFEMKSGLVSANLSGGAGVVLNKTTSGTAILSGINNIGATSSTTASEVQAGELDITGTTTISASSGATNVFPLGVGSTGGTATLRISAGTLNLYGRDGNGYALRVGDTNSGGAGKTGAVLQDSGTVNIYNGGLGLGYLAGDSGSYTITTGALALTDTYANSYMVVGRQGAGTFTQSGGTVSLYGNATSSGITLASGGSGASGTYNMNGGTLRTMRIQTQPNGTASFNFAGGTIAPYGSAGLTIGSATSGNNVDLTLTGSGGTISSLDNSGAARTVDVYSKITGGYGITFAGNDGTINLYAANTYIGATTVAGGLLNVDGSLANTSSVSVANSATLGGVGSIAGAVSLASGATLAPGDAGVGTLTLGDTLSLSAGALFAFDLATTSASDKVSMTSGALTLNGQQFSDFTFNTLAGFGAGTYTLIDAGSVSGSLGADVSGTLGGLAATLAVSGDDLVLNVTAVPEPSGLLLLAAGLLGLLVYAWRKRR